jgi:hypothetical protein
MGLTSCSGRKKDMPTKKKDSTIWMMKGPCHEIFSGSKKLTLHDRAYHSNGDCLCPSPRFDGGYRVYLFDRWIHDERCKTRRKHLNKRAEEVNESADADTFLSANHVSKFIARFFKDYGGADGSTSGVDPSITGISVACLQAGPTMNVAKPGANI